MEQKEGLRLRWAAKLTGKIKLISVGSDDSIGEGRR
jgi:hypothetical protein